jgi:hypothetical protein
MTRAGHISRRSVQLKRPKLVRVIEDALRGSAATYWTSLFSRTASIAVFLRTGLGRTA